MQPKLSPVVSTPPTLSGGIEAYGEHRGVEPMDIIGPSGLAPTSDDYKSDATLLVGSTAKTWGPSTNQIFVASSRGEASSSAAAAATDTPSWPSWVDAAHWKPATSETGFTSESNQVTKVPSQSQLYSLNQCENMGDEELRLLAERANRALEARRRISTHESKRPHSSVV